VLLSGTKGLTRTFELDVILTEMKVTVFYSLQMCISIRPVAVPPQDCTQRHRTQP